MKRVFFAATATLLAIGPTATFHGLGETPAASLPPGPVVAWSLESQRAIVPPPAGVGNKFPGEAAVYMGIVHAAIYDAAVAIEGGYHPYTRSLTAPPDTSPAAAVAAAAHGVLVELLPQQRGDLDKRFAEYISRLPANAAKANGIALGEQVAAAIVALRADDGRNADPEYVQPPPAPGVFEPDPTRPVLGLRLSRIRPLALDSPSQFRPEGPTPLTSQEYAADFDEVKRLGRFDSASRTDDQTIEALFWTDHDLRQWNEGLQRLGADRGLNFVQTARMLAMAHVSGGDAMIACFDAKYHYMFWRPAVAIPRAETDGAVGTEPDTTWRPLRAAPNFPEYPSAHACHTSAVVEAISTFFGTRDVQLSLDSHATGTTRKYNHLNDVVSDVEQARVLAGFHFRNSDLAGSTLGRHVARFVLGRFFRPRD
ncbi:MAG: vanadium-dependent haloperoxidase [Acidobacteriota bacterium]